MEAANLGTDDRQSFTVFINKVGNQHGGNAGNSKVPDNQF